MNEAGFTRKIHKRLSKDVYTWKISDRFSAGIPDAYYSGVAGDLWIEYKYVPRPCPRTGALPKLSELQRIWLRGRHAEGRNVATVIGFSDGTAFLFPGDTFNVRRAPEDLVDCDFIVRYIEEMTCGQ